MEVNLKNMAAELYIKCIDTNWFRNNKNLIEEKIKNLKTFVLQKNNEFWLKDYEASKDNKYFDVRLFLDKDEFILMEITFHPKGLEESLGFFLKWLRNNTTIIIEDEDGEPSSW